MILLKIFLLIWRNIISIFWIIRTLMHARFWNLILIIKSFIFPLVWFIHFTLISIFGFNLSYLLLFVILYNRILISSLACYTWDAPKIWISSTLFVWAYIFLHFIILTSFFSLLSCDLIILWFIMLRVYSLQISLILWFLRIWLISLVFVYWMISWKSIG
jgi:hypothetical protein